MEGYKFSSTQEQRYDEFDLGSGGHSHETGVTNLEDEPVAKILLPSLNQKKSSTIKINLQNPGGSNKKVIEILKEKSNSPEVIPEVETIPVPTQDKDASQKHFAPKFNLKAIDKEEELHRLFGLKFPTPEKPYGSLFVWESTRLGRRIACKACNVHCTSETDLIYHANGKKHLNLLDELEEGIKNPGEDMQLAPGEPVPPGFEDEMKRVPMCQEALDEFKGSAVIGLEYIVELLCEDQSEGRFVCLLCDKKGESQQPNVCQNMISHIIGTSHRLAYIKKHFPSAHKAIQKCCERDRKTERGSIVLLVAANIEADFGRLRPRAVDKNTFEVRKDIIRDQIEQDRHHSETPEKTFVELINPTREKSPQRKFERRNSADFVDEDEVQEIPRKFSVHEGTRKDGQSPVIERGRGKRQNSRESAIGTSENAGTKKKQRMDDLLKDTTPISLSSDSLSLSSSSRSRSRSPGRHNRRYPDRDGGRYNRPGYPDKSLNRRERFDRNQMHRRSRSPPRFRRSRSPKYRRSRSPNFPRRRVSRSPRPLRRSNSPRLRGSLSPHHSKSPSQTRSQASSQDIRGRGAGRSRRDRSPANEKPLTLRDKWIKFREEADEIEVEMQKQREYHQKNPEKHPLYAEEWKKFWNVRYKEVQAMGKDPNKHDYKPEWVTYWNRRVGELLDIEFKEQKDALKKKYELIGEEETKQQTFKPRPKPQDKDNGRGYEYAPHNAGREYNNSQGGSVSDVKDTWKALTGGEIQHAPYTGPPREPTWHPPNRQSYKREPAHPVAPVRVYENREEMTSVIGVLRLLTALESLLGSFGTKVNALLAEAISLEKIEPGSSDKLAVNADNIVFFETVREKFKGQLMAGIVEHFNQKAVRMAVTDLTVLLAKAPPVEKIPPKIPTATVVSTATSQVPKSALKPAAAVEVPGVGAVDKAAIAVQIAEALLAQGRTDVSEAELEQLVDAVVGMAKQSAESNKPVSAASFVKQMEQEGKPAKQPESGFVQEKASSSALKALQTAYKRSPPAKKQPEPVSNCGFNLSNVAEISDLAEADLKSCLRIFQHLSTAEQRSLVMYLKKLEDTNPQQVEKLRKYVNLGAGDVIDEEEEKQEEPKSWERPSSPFSSRAGGSNPFMNEARHGEDSDEEYTFEDVYKAAARNVDASHKRALQEVERKKKEEEEAAKMKLLNKPADSIKQVIEATTDNMMASLRSLTQRKDSPLVTRGNTPQNNVPPVSTSFVPNKPEPPAKEPTPPQPTVPTITNVRQIEPSTVPAMQPAVPPPGLDTSSTVAQYPGYNTAGYANTNYMPQQVGYQQPPQVGYNAGQQYVQYPPATVQHYGAFGSDPYYQYQQAQPDMYAQQYMAQQQQMPPQVGYPPPQDVNSYHPAQYSASYEKRQQKTGKRNW